MKATGELATSTPDAQGHDHHVDHQGGLLAQDSPDGAAESRVQGVAHGVDGTGPGSEADQDAGAREGEPKGELHQSKFSGSPERCSRVTDPLGCNCRASDHAPQWAMRHGSSRWSAVAVSSAAPAWRSRIGTISAKMPEQAGEPALTGSEMLANASASSAIVAVLKAGDNSASGPAWAGFANQLTVSCP